MDRSMPTNALVAVFKDRGSADRAKQQLIQQGFDSDQIEIQSTSDLTRYAGSGGAGLSGAYHDTSGGGISGFFARLFGKDSSDEDRRYYSEAIKRGDFAVIVHADEHSIDRAADILNNAGAVEVEETKPSDTYSSGTRPAEARPSDTRASDTRRTTPLKQGESTTIPVVREDLKVGKRAVQRGGVRVHSTITDRPAEEQVHLREERVRVDRRPADRPATNADFDAADREVVEVNETVEEPVISKTARVVEEVVVSKDVRDRTETVRDKVQQSQVNVENVGERNVGNVGDTDFRNDFRTRYGAVGTARYEDYEPAYRYGYEMANNPRYRGRTYEDVEDTLRTDYTRRYPGSAWDRTKDAVRYGWDKVTRKR